MNGVDDPVDAGILADGLVLRVDENDLVVLVCRILVDPVGAEDTQIGAAATDTLFGGGLERALVLQLIDTLVGGLACVILSVYRFLPSSRLIHTVGSTLGRGSLAATTTDTHAVDDIALLGLVAETASLVWSRRTRSAVDDIELSELY